MSKIIENTQLISAIKSEKVTLDSFQDEIAKLKISVQELSCDTCKNKQKLVPSNRSSNSCSRDRDRINNLDHLCWIAGQIF